MNNNSDTYIFPERFRILSGSALKIIALFTMFIDHTASILLRNLDFAVTPFCEIFGKKISIYFLCRLVGRISFPIYAFLITEGYIHTSNKKRYGINLLIFAIISELPWNLEHTGTLHCSNQNVFFTLFFGYVGICAADRYINDNKHLILSLFGLLALSLIFNADYGSYGFAFIVFLYISRNQKVIQAVIGSCFLPSRWKSGLAFIPINMYNGKRGFIKGKIFKYTFYLAYPLHMIILFVIKYVIWS